jgi:hypothetical protein
MAASDVADLLLRIDATTEGLRRELKKAEDQVAGASGKMDVQVAKVDSRFQKLGEGVKKAGMAIAAAMAAAGLAVGAMVRNSINSADAASKQAQAIGVTVESLTGLQYAAELAGVSNDALTSSLGRFNRVIGDAEQGMVKQRQAFDDLGISIRGANGEVKNSDALLLEVAEKFSKYEDGAQKSAVAQELFGRSGAALIPLLNQGADGITELTDEAARLGLVLDTETARAAEQFNDSLTTLRAAGKGVGNTLMRDLLPSLNSITGLMLDYSENTDAASTASKALDNVLKSLVTVGISISAVFEAAGKRLGALAAAFMAAISGDFKGAYTIMDEANKDSVKIGEDTVKRLRKLWSGDYAKIGEDAAKTTDKKKEAFERLTAATEESEKELERFNTQLQRTLDRLYPGRQAVRELQAEYRLLEDALKRGLIAQQDFDNWLEKNVLAEVTVTARRHVKDLKEEADPFAKAWETAMERIDSAFADAWKGAFDSFRDFADGLKNAFKQLLAEMAHMAITKPILISLGIGGSSSALAGVGGSSSPVGLLSGVSSAFSNIKAMATAASGAMVQLSANAFHTLSGMGQIGQTVAYNMAGAGQNFNSMFGSTGNLGADFATGALLNVGASWAGGRVGGRVAGSFTDKEANSNWGQIAGTFAGMGNPVLTFFTSAIGSALDVAFGSKKNRIGGADIDFTTGSSKLWGTQRDQYQDPMRELSGVLLSFADAIGGSEAMFSISAGNKSPLMMDGKEYANVADLIEDAMDVLILQAKNLAWPVKQLGAAFEGTMEQTAGYTMALQGLWDQATQNPVQLATEQLKEAGKSAFQVYWEQQTALRELASSFDGSIESTIALSNALGATQAMSYQLTFIFDQVSQQVGTLFNGLRESIRTSLMSQEELYNYQRNQVHNLTDLLGTLTDPEAILSTSQQIERLVGDMWRSLDETQRPEMGQEFLSYLDQTQDIAEERLQRGVDVLERNAHKNNQMVQEGIAAAAQDLASSAQSYAMSAQQMQTAVNMFLAGVQGMGGYSMAEVNQ